MGHFHELFDNTSENMILRHIFNDADIQSSLLKFYKIIVEREKKNDFSSYSFFRFLYEKMNRPDYFQIDSLQQKEILSLFFGKYVFEEKDFSHTFDTISREIEDFRMIPQEEKGFLFIFIESIVEEKINIPDVGFEKMIQNARDIQELTFLFKELILTSLDMMYNDIENVLVSCKSWFEAHLSAEENYLDEHENMKFQNHFLELVTYMISYVTHNYDFEEQIQQIQEKFLLQKQ